MIRKSPRYKNSSFFETRDGGFTIYLSKNFEFIEILVVYILYDN